MNIFMLDYDMRKNVSYYCDKHVVKMITEHTQILCSAYYYTGEDKLAPYKLAHKNNPCMVWARHSLSNWLYLYILNIYLYSEYRYRYGKTHRAGEISIRLNRPSLIDSGLTRTPLCMPDYCKKEDNVESYREYYRQEKLSFLSYTKRDKPYWLEEDRM